MDRKTIQLFNPVNQMQAKGLLLTWLLTTVSVTLTDTRCTQQTISHTLGFHYRFTQNLSDILEMVIKQLQSDWVSIK